MAAAESDRDLVRRSQEGDREAFAALVERHQRRMYNAALRMLGREEDALDATQDAFLSALRKLGGFRGDAAFTTWMHRVTLNACYDLLRKRGREPILDLDPEREHEPPPLPDHADVTAGSMDAAAALLAVPEVFRSVLVLHDVQDLPVEEVARILDVPLGTVKSRLHRGRIALARALGLEATEPERPLGPSNGPS